MGLDMTMAPDSAERKAASGGAAKTQRQQLPEKAAVSRRNDLAALMLQLNSVAP